MALGYGTQAYFDLHIYLIFLFLILVVLAIPQFYILLTYHNGNKTYSGLFHHIGLGNLGFAEPLCKDVALGVNTLKLKCDTGFITDVVSFGVTPNGASILDACMPNEETVKCYGMYDDSDVKEFILSNCKGERECHLELS